jgi:DNA repair exonuclease SbcCD nuclease subunit
MKFILLSDLHLTCNTPIARLDNIEETWKWKFEFILKYSVENDFPIIIAGDVFDKPRDWKTLSEFIKLITQYEPSIMAVFGQHDMYLYSANKDYTSLGILIKSELVGELGEVPAGGGANGRVKIYGASWGQEVPLPNYDDGCVNILVIHKNISDRPLFPGHEYTDALQFLQKHPEYQVIVCGDIHRRFHITYYGKNIINPGPLLRMEATEYNMTYEPKFAVLDIVNQSVEWVTIPHEPAEKVLSRKHIDNKKETESMLDDFIKNISIDHKITFSFKENLQEYLTKNEIKQDVINIISKIMEE